MTLVVCPAGVVLISSTASAQVKTDSSEVSVRQPAPDRIEAYGNDSEFMYEETAPGRSIILMLIEEVIRFFDEHTGEGTGSTVIRSLFILILLGVLLLILNQVMGGKISLALTGRSASDEIRFSRDPATQKSDDLTRLIDSAAEAGNFREAVRLIYQKTLKELSTAGLIEWAANKTNHDYLYEIDSHPSSDSFRTLTRIYEYTEYGDFGIGREGFNNVRTLYSRLSEQLGGGSDV